MFEKDLLQERNLLHNIQNHHLEKLFSPDNPTGILLCHKNNNVIRWQRRYLHEDLLVTVNICKSECRLAEKLAINLYRIICIQFIQKRIDLIDKTIRSLHTTAAPEVSQNDPLAQYPLHSLLYRIRNRPHAPADFFAAQSPYRPLILSHLQKEYAWIIDWYLADFVKYEEFPQYLQHPVKLGYKVRSKSEVMGADLLLQEGILFHYEERLLLDGKPVFPDFYIPITVTEKYAWEHNGAMDDSGYFSRKRDRLVYYLDHKCYPGINMITTYETKSHPMTEEQFDRQVRWLKNRYRIAFPDLPPDESLNMYDLAADKEFQRIK